MGYNGPKEANTEISKLHQKNEKLTKDYTDLKCLYDQLISEAPQESSDPRRLMLLKSQLSMLERQCHNMTLQLNQRQVSLQHAHVTLENATAEMETWLSAGSGNTVIINDTQLNNVLKTIRGVGKKFNKPSETYEVVLEKQAINNKFSEAMSSPQDIFQYNTKQMSNLEHKLSELMVAMEQFKCSVSEKYVHKSKPSSKDLSTSIRDFTSANQESEQHFNDLTNQINDCCYDLTLVSLLQPQLQYKNKRISDEVTLDCVMEYLKKHTRKKEVFDVIPLVWQLASHRAKLCKIKNIMFETEVQRCHQRLELHTKFVLDLLSGVEQMFSEFEKNSLQPYLSDPLSGVIDSYNLLQNEQTNENFTAFFKKLDQLIPNLQSIVKLLENSMTMQNSSELQKMFRREIYNFTKGCLADRRKSENEIINQEKETKERKAKLVVMLKGKDDKEDVS